MKQNTPLISYLISLKMTPIARSINLPLSFHTAICHVHVLHQFPFNFSHRAHNFSQLNNAQNALKCIKLQLSRPFFHPNFAPTKKKRCKTISLFANLKNKYCNFSFCCNNNSVSIHHCGTFLAPAQAKVPTHSVDQDQMPFSSRWCAPRETQNMRVCGVVQEFQMAAADIFCKMLGVMRVSIAGKAK